MKILCVGGPVAGQWLTFNGMPVEGDFIDLPHDTGRLEPTRYKVVPVQIGGHRDWVAQPLLSTDRMTVDRLLAAYAAAYAEEPKPA